MGNDNLIQYVEITGWYETPKKKKVKVKKKIKVK
jgi:hypothetical protein